ncbi:methionine synthase [Alteromonas sp. MTD1]|uniref:methionine synthase n=1 Tax=Alteromonas sp. MTD1 TaxID=3057962 RepID=UPI0036F29111
MNTLIPTCIAGSLPKPIWLAEPETLWSPWKLANKALEQGKQDALKLALHDQKNAGLDIICDGEQTRQHFVTTFIEQLNGVDCENKKTMRIRNRYDAQVPVIVGPISLSHFVFEKDALFLRSQTDAPIKWALPGPLTMVDTLCDEYYGCKKTLANEFAKILNKEARALEAAGVDVIQFDEPAFNVFPDEVNEWGVDALETAIDGLTCKTAVHICYGYGIKANNDWKKSLGTQWRQYELIFPKIKASNISAVSLECHNSHVPLSLISLLEGKEIMVGAIDVANDSIESPEEVAETLRQALAYVAPDKLIACTNCGMAPMAADVARKKLAALTAGVRIIRDELHAT